MVDRPLWHYGSCASPTAKQPPGWLFMHPWTIVLAVLAGPASQFSTACIGIFSERGSCSCTACVGAKSTGSKVVMFRKIPWSSFKGYTAINYQMRSKWKNTTQESVHKYNEQLKGADICDMECILDLGCSGQILGLWCHGFVFNSCQKPERRPAGRWRVIASNSGLYFWEVLHETNYSRVYPLAI